MGKMTKAMEDIAAKLVGVDVTELPAVSAANNGAVLMVVDGQWAIGSIPSQLPAVTSENAGQVLTVSAEGAWGAAALPSDGDT